MADEDTQRGSWLPPRAPGAADPPHYERGAAAAPRWQAPAERSERVAAEPLEPAPTEPSPGRRQPVVVAGPAQRDLGATVAVTIAIISLALLVLSIGAGFWLTLPLSGLALHLGRRARERAAGEAHGQANAVIVLGMVGVVLGLLAAVGWIVAILVLGYGPSDLQHDLQRELDRQSQQALIHAARTMFGR
ncbi:MAG: hypothetical protein QOK21_182 [Solirubrobacteraceae bacterium]|nr:hypothetical protein [Solirubrobacteraceae bacterium]